MEMDFREDLVDDFRGNVGERCGFGVWRFGG